MGLLDAFEAGPPVKEPPCAVCKLQEELKRRKNDAEYRGLKALITAILIGRKTGANPKHTWNSYNVVKVLNDDGYAITRRQLEKHLQHTRLDEDGAR
jgi:hypothetical protein